MQITIEIQIISAKWTAYSPVPNNIPPSQLINFWIFYCPLPPFSYFDPPPPPYPRLLVFQILYCRYFDISEIIKAGFLLVDFFSHEAPFFVAKIFDNGKYKKHATDKIRSSHPEVFYK